MVAQIVLSAAHVAIGISALLLILGIIGLILKISKNRQEMDDKKVDKSVYDEHIKAFDCHKMDNHEAFRQIQKSQNDIQVKQNELLNKLVEQYTELRVDVRWIKDKIK